MFDTAVAKCRVRPELLIWEQESGGLQPHHLVQPQWSPRCLIADADYALLIHEADPEATLRVKQVIPGEPQGLKLQEEVCHPC